MPIVVCEGCGRKTNSTMIVPPWDGVGSFCTATSTPDGFKQGCGYEQASPNDRAFADQLIERTAKTNIERLGC